MSVAVLNLWIDIFRDHGKIEGTRQFLHPISNLVRPIANRGKIKHTCMLVDARFYE